MMTGAHTSCIIDTYISTSCGSSGWVKVIDDSGSKGLVPASYLEFSEVTETRPPGPLQYHPSQGSGQYGTPHNIDYCHGPEIHAFQCVVYMSILRRDQMSLESAKVK
jgi:hypothetical protein